MYRFAALHCRHDQTCSGSSRHIRNHNILKKTRRNLNVHIHFRILQNSYNQIFCSERRAVFTIKDRRYKKENFQLYRTELPQFQNFKYSPVWPLISFIKDSIQAEPKVIGKRG